MSFRARRNTSIYVGYCSHSFTFSFSLPYSHLYRSKKICHHFEGCLYNCQTRFVAKKAKPQRGRRRRRKSTNMTKTTPTTLLTSPFSSVFFSPSSSSFLVEMVFVAITVIVVFILRSSAYFDRFVLSHKRAHSTALNSLLLLKCNRITIGRQFVSLFALLFNEKETSECFIS